MALIRISAPRCKRWQLMIVLLAALNSLSLQNSAASETAGARIPVWSDLKTFDQVTDIEAAGDGFGYFIAGPGKIAVTSNKGTDWKTIQLESAKPLDGLFADGHGTVIATSKDSYFVSSVNTDNWKEEVIPADTHIRSVGFSEQVQGVVWRLEYKDSVEGEPGVVNIAVSTNGGQQWESMVKVPWLPNVIKPVSASMAWGYSARRAFLLKSGGRENYLVDLKLDSGERVVRGGVLGESLVLATTLGRVFQVFPDRHTKVLPPIGLGYLKFFSVYGDGRATAIDVRGGIYQSDNVVAGEWRLTGTFRDGQLAFGWRDGGFISRTLRGEVNVRLSADGEDKVVYEVPTGTIDQMAVSSAGVILLTTYSGAIFRSEDHGGSWKQCCLDISPIHDLVMNTAGVAAIATDDGRVLFSKDSGKHWIVTPMLPMVGDIGNLLITSTSEILVQVTDNYPYSKPHLYTYVEKATEWKPAGINADKSLISATPGGGIRALSFDGTVHIRGDNGEWKSLKWNVLEKDSSPSADNSDRNPYSLWTWADANHAWLARKHSVLYRTRDGGESWVRRNLPPQITLKTLYFFDDHNGFLLGEQQHPASTGGTYYATTHDAGDTWVGRNLPAARVQTVAMSEAGTGVIATPTGLLPLNGLKPIPMVSSRAELSFWGDVSVVVTQDLPGSPNPFAANAVTDVSLMYKVGNAEEWQESKQTGKGVHPLDETRYSIDWRPRVDVPDIKLEDPIALKLRLSNAEDSITLMPPVIRYMPPIAAHATTIKACLTILAVVGIAALLLLSIYWLSPMSLAWLSNWQERIGQLLDKAPGIISVPLQILLMLNPIARLTRTPRVARAWIDAYSAGKVELGGLDKRTLAYYLTYPSLLDAWVARRVDSFRMRLQVKNSQLGATAYVPMSVLVSTAVTPQHWLTPSPTFLKGHVSTAKLTLEIVGGGGVGKTALLAQLARWCQAPVEDSLLGHTALALLLQDGMSNPLAALKAQLDDKVDAIASDSCEPVIKAAMLHKRLVLFIDGLSECEKGTQQDILDFHSCLPGAMLVLSSRESLAPTGSSLVQIRPELIGVENIGWFIGQYVLQRSLASKIDQQEQLLLSKQLLTLLEDRNKSMRIAPVFVVLLVESSLASPTERLSVNTLAATVQHYVRSLTAYISGPLAHDDHFATASVALANLSLAPNFVPTEFDQNHAASAVKKALGQLDSAGAIDALVTANLLIRRTGDAGLRVRFRLDPVAEYLVAIEQVKTLQGDEQWRAHVDQLRALNKQGIAIGYTKALRECLRTLGAEYGVPDSVTAQLQTLSPARELQADDPLQGGRPS